jgi:uncharacterized protein involved in exopolysaccharide biosynthesis
VPASEDQTTHSLEPTPREHVSLLAVLRRRALVIVLTTILCGAAAAAFAFSDRDSYESTAKLLFRQSIGPELNAVGLDPTSPDADNLAKNNVEVVASRRVAEATAQDLQRRGLDMSADDVEDDVRVTGTNDSEVVEVVASAGSAPRAALLANAYSESVVDLAGSDQRRLALRARDEVRDQLKALPAREREGPLGTRMRGDINQLETLAAVGTGSPQVIQPGYPPSSRSGSPIQTIVLGTLFGLLLGLALALLREQSDRRIAFSRVGSGGAIR